MRPSSLTQCLIKWLAIVALVSLSTYAFGAETQQSDKGDNSDRKTDPTAQTTVSSPSEEDSRDLLFKGMTYRLIGPFRGGRSLTAVGIPGDPTTYYFGAAAGGVWKSTDGAATWTPIFDKQHVSAVGSLAVANSDPNVIYVGTGEALRGNISHGDGIYKSVDGGKTWKNVGLHDTRAIGKVIISPTNPDVVFVAAFGHPYGTNTERGIFRTTDGGKSWEKVLYRNEKTGGIDVTFDPHNSEVLFASLWEAQRTPWALTSGGPDSGLYRSSDGGTTWKEIEGHGLPQKPYGKIGVAVSANSDRVYALIEAHDRGLYRSDDGGDNWELVNSDHRLSQRSWYFMHVIADPQDPNTVYVLNVDGHRSTDGGRTFNNIKVVHGDNHGLWIDPRNPRRLIVANDGGVTVSLDGGKHWTGQNNQPTAQFYHVITDDQSPYRVYGSQQDNSSVAIASRSNSGTIGRADWFAVGGGEAGYIAPYPTDPNIVFASDYHGQVTRFDRRTGEVKDIAVLPELTDGEGSAILEHRFQWTAPLIVSPHDSNVLYYGGEQVFKTTDQGRHWEPISPDLTRNDKSKQQLSGGPITKDDAGTEYYDTVLTIAESPLTKGLIWIGTDDGLIQLTRDGGKNWSNVTPKDLPDWSRISLIEASPHDAGTAYVAVDRHQNDDLHPHAYKTTDYGRTWMRISTGIPEGAFVRVIREDPKKPGLLYAGTETGVYISFTDGKDWRPLQLNLPTTPVYDLLIKNDDLVLATHGRSFWILDDITPLRQFTEEVNKTDVYLYRPAIAYRLLKGVDLLPDFPLVIGDNRPFGAIIYFYLKQAPKQQVTVEILDASGGVLRTYSSSKLQHLDEPPQPDTKKPAKELEPKVGMNRFVWDLRYQGATSVPEYYLFFYKDGTRGPVALSGQYKVRLTVDGRSQTVPLELRPDPALNVTQEDMEKQFRLLLDIRDELTRVYDAVNEIQDVRAQLEGLRRRLPASSRFTAISDAASALEERSVDIQDNLINLNLSANEDTFAYPAKNDAKLAFLALAVEQNTQSAPTEAEYRAFAKLKKEADDYLMRWTELQQTEGKALQKLTAEEGLPIIVLPANGLFHKSEPAAR